MFDFYTVSAAMLFVGLGFGVYSLTRKSDRKKVEDVKPTPVPTPTPDPKPPVKPVTNDFFLTSVDRMIRPSNERKRNVGGRVTIPDVDMKRFEAMDGKLTFKWTRDLKVTGPGSVSVNGGGTPTSKFIDFKLTRKNVHIEAFAFGTVRCDVLIDNKVVATGSGRVKLGIIPANPL